LDYILNSSLEDTRQAELLSLQKLMKSGDFKSALKQLTIVLEEDPNFVDALYMKAVCLRYLKNTDGAFEALQKLQSATPEFGRAFQEKGHIYRSQRDYQKAINAYRKATQYNPSLGSSWKAQVELLRKINAPIGEINAAQAQASRIANLPGELVAVINFISEKRLLKAETICRAYLRQHPTDTEAMRLLADIAEKFGSMNEAEFLLESAVEFEPNNIQLRLDYIQVLRKKQKLQATYEQAKYLYDKDSSVSAFQSQMAICHMQLGDYEKSIQLFETVKQLEPNNFSNLTSLGHALKTSGENEAGIQSYQQAYKANPTHGEAYFSLANLKTYKFTDKEIADMLIVSIFYLRLEKHMRIAKTLKRLLIFTIKLMNLDVSKCAMMGIK